MCNKHFSLQHTYWQFSSYSKGQSQHNQDNLSFIIPFPALPCDSHTFIHEPQVYNAYLPIPPPSSVQPTGVIYVALGTVPSYHPPKQQEHTGYQWKLSSTKCTVITCISLFCSGSVTTFQNLSKSTQLNQQMDNRQSNSAAGEVAGTDLQS